MTKPDFAAQTASKIAALMERDGINWIKPWSAVAAPLNAATGKGYRGANNFLLSLAGWLTGMDDARWMGFHQAKALGASVRKGEKAIRIASPMARHDDETGETKVFGFRSACVFNISQFDGVDEARLHQRARLPGTVLERHAEADAWIEATGIEVRHEGASAFYAPSRDQVVMPPREAFIAAGGDTPEQGYYSTVFHELGHATGHETRLDRGKGNRFGSEAYAFEELIAEMIAAMCCQHVGIIQEPREASAAYIKSWATKLREDPRALFRAASDAQAGFDWLEMRKLCQQRKAA